MRSITVPISTFPPTAMVYNVAKPLVDKQDADSDDESKPPIDMVSAAIMAKILEDREKDKIFARHCNTCTCHRSVLKVDTETQTSIENNEDRLASTKDYFSKNDRVDVKNGKSSKESSQSKVREVSFHYNKSGHLRINDANSRHAMFHCINEIVETKSTANDETSKVYNRYSHNSKNYLNSKNLIKHKSTTNETNTNDKSKSITNEDKTDAQVPLNHCTKITSQTKSSKDTRNFDDQAKIDVINERLWKSNWVNSKNLPNRKENEIQLDVINERVWKNSSQNSEKPPQFTVIEVKSSDDLTSQSEKMQTEPATSPSFSSDSAHISSSDPSSFSSDQLCNQTNSTSKKERVTGPRNCLMRVTPGSKNILLDNVGAYETVLYTSGCSRPNTALVHLTKSQSGRSASISSEENAPCSMHENTHLQRVAQWVDTLSVNCDSNVQQLDSSSEEPLLNAKIKTNQPNGTLSSPAQHQRDLMTFEVSSEDEQKLSLEYNYQPNIAKEMEETYMKLAANLDSSLKTSKAVEIDMMTIEKYRKEQKLSYKSSQANFQTKLNNPKT